jgi:tetraacyldisaccharide 4'-kinase
MPFRKLLYPFSVLYGVITFIRNVCYDIGIFHSWEIPVKSICIGNLSTGGTGKTPHVSYLANYFSKDRNVAILSRGYGRQTKGFRLVTEHSLSSEVGDEPLTYAQRFGKNVIIAVCESRKEGIQQLLKQNPKIDLVLLDDAFQHRAVKAGFNVLLTQFNKPFNKDIMLPAGNLREWKSGRNRADAIVVTKCPEIDTQSSISWSEELKFDEKKIYFSEISYGEPISFGSTRNSFQQILLVTGIADPEPLKNHLSEHGEVTLIQYGDHHEFTQADIQKIHQKFDTFAPENNVILTTEKDCMRLKDRLSEWKINEYPWYYLPITVRVKNETEFLKTIRTYVDTI